ncbi:MAG TPA: hypothetical protein VHA82_17205 [Ramlibacter sp.]|uniref:hypothetical protein n=1 Tax=Ramlibacter sp. TaxID=1917967 RepID=UPI002CA8514D|nr:hypothetical protein [Ramlibacter sp.]HVZ45551.1 hypothetical protein [Ramlibacter sp.]
MSDRSELELEVEAMDWDSRTGALDVLVGEFVLVTPESSDHPRYATISALLERIRKALGMDAVFVSQFIGNQPVVRYTTPLDDGGEQPCDPLEETYGQRVLESRPRLPRPRSVSREQLNPVFTAVPVASKDGSEYGTLCCRSYSTGAGSHEALQSVARLVAATLDGADSSISGFMGLSSHVPAPAYPQQQAAFH